MTDLNVMIRQNKCSCTVRYFIFKVLIYMMILKKIIGQLSEIAFPVTCVCCSCSVAGYYKHICEWCEKERFEPAISLKGDILPEFIFLQFSLWNFDKGGYLQQMLHDLKYNNIRSVGEELGFLLGKSFLKSYSDSVSLFTDEKRPVLLPVPLHRSKLRKRGFNQARVISEGINRATSWEIAPIDTLVRVKRTNTQTGLSLAERSDNLKDAFLISDQEFLSGVIPIIVDDVFTTGSTTFELANTIAQSGKAKSVILTVAKA